MPIFVVKRRTPVDGEKPRMILADKRSQVESFILGDYAIDKLSPEEGVELGSQGVKIEEVKG